jgi:PleD family two-component response regulator
VRGEVEYRNVPFVFYSRKITPDDVVMALRAGAVDAIRKRDWRDRKELLDRLREAQALSVSSQAESVRRLGLNVNTALFPPRR